MPRSRSSDRVMSAFERECRRLLEIRLKATTKDEREDAEWALQYVITLNGQGRLDEYFASRAESERGAGHPVGA